MERNYDGIFDDDNDQLMVETVQTIFDCRVLSDDMLDYETVSAAVDEGDAVEDAFKRCSKSSVLFVDDETNLLDSFDLHFGRKYNVYKAQNVKEAIDTLQRVPDIEVIISDLKMPGGSGLELLSWARDNYQGASRILLTGHADLDVAVKSINDVGVFRLLTKPCPPDVLGESILHACFARKVEVMQKAELSGGLNRDVIDGVIYGFSHIIEEKDPYTARHQEEVARLCRLIGKEMRLTDTQYENLEYAAQLHDIGKVAIPLAYLNKSGKLCDVEFSVIKKHPQSGYHMLSHIGGQMQDIATIVLQHHERNDGSGYPLGLRAEHIMLEAKILAVADTVEAMISHRPYRPSLGIDAALGEIRMGRGTLYDAVVVDITCRIIESGKFKYHSLQDDGLMVG